MAYVAFQPSTFYDGLCILLPPMRYPWESTTEAFIGLISVRFASYFRNIEASWILLVNIFFLVPQVL